MQDDIRAQLAGAGHFSKLDFKSTFWQLELHPDPRYLTVFHPNDKLYLYIKLIMGENPAQGQLNAALKPIFSHIPNGYLIHDIFMYFHINIFKDHNLALQEVMKAIDQANLALNSKKCSFAKTETAFWGIIFPSSSVRPDLEKIKALKNLTPPKNRSELKSFICMMQSNNDFIPNFSKSISSSENF